MEVKIVKKHLRHHKHPKWIIVHPKNNSRVGPASFKTEKAIRRFLKEEFPTITVVN
jgi:hypothetical protein